MEPTYTKLPLTAAHGLPHNPTAGANWVRWEDNHADPLAYNRIRVTPLNEPSDLVPLLRENGRVEIFALPRRPGPHGVWPCATCEQLHLNDEVCPLAHGMKPRSVHAHLTTDQGEFVLLMTAATYA